MQKLPHRFCTLNLNAQFFRKHFINDNEQFVNFRSYGLIEVLNEDNDSH